MEEQVTISRQELIHIQQGLQAFLDMVNVIQRFQALPIPSILENAQHNCPILIGLCSKALESR